MRKIREILRLIKAGLDKRFSVHLVNAPVREVLNAIVPAHGDVWWHVSYRESPPIYRHCTIRLNGFDNWSIADAARVPPPPMRPR